MRRRSLTPPRPSSEINVTPLIDVVMCLIIFFLIVGRLAADQRALVPLPVSAQGIQASEPEALVIALVRQEEGGGPEPAIIRVAGRDVPLAELPAAITQALAAAPSAAVHLRADRDLPYSAVARVIRACRDAGVPAVRLVTERGP